MSGIDFFFLGGGRGGGGQSDAALVALKINLHLFKASCSAIFALPIYMVILIQTPKQTHIQIGQIKDLNFVCE